jgi:hypothetical protein
MHCGRLCKSRLTLYDSSKTADTGATKCNAIHRTIVEQFKTAIVYGKSVKHQPQRVGLAHELEDEDVGEWYPVDDILWSSRYAKETAADLRHKGDHASLLRLVHRFLYPLCSLMASSPVW